MVEHATEDREVTGSNPVVPFWFGLRRKGDEGELFTKNKQKIKILACHLLREIVCPIPPPPFLWIII